MRVLVVLAHPRTDSFNHAIASTVGATLEASGHAVDLCDLYDEGFDPLFTPDEMKRDFEAPPRLAAEIARLKNADAVVVIHPNWWGQAPAILKGWLDRVLRVGETYRFGTNDKGEGIMVSQLKARKALVFTTSNTPQAAELALYGDPLDNYWKRCVWGALGIPTERRNFESVILSTPEQRAEWLSEAARLTREAIG
ncbi:NAD(P)H-dependent oxidoreductase [Telmatospirillum siberiense]|uniref:NAD(P)H dehydrogenase n=1 Tax=Telmatospirillum siberiense TaxID=382514 RepID=A0A2N3PQI2_9PROT|nr:NAD(P)H-dependent oxidoreductase [Telmatospirillum siberiense]PKU22657.1 NAD(P)H dehydrogenase [Telmatospirillum siberiense]